MGTSYLIDTNVIIDYFDNRLPYSAIVWVEQNMDNGACSISIINRIEIFSYKTSEEEEGKLIDFTDRCDLIYLTDEIAARTASLRQGIKIKLPDAIIAATALHYHLTLVTRNTHDFKNIPGLTVVNPHDIT